MTETQKSPLRNTQTPDQSLLVKKESPVNIPLESIPDKTSQILNESESFGGDFHVKMTDSILQEIRTLPPLSKTIIDINELRMSDDPDNERLQSIAQSDPMIVANILKVANSAMYGLPRKIQTVADAIKMLGFKIVSSIALITAMGKHLKPNLDPYGTDMENFANISIMQSYIIESWRDPALSGERSDIQSAAFLQEIGKIAISLTIIKNGLTQRFQKEISESEDISATEKRLLGLSSAEVTAHIFAHWKFPQKITHYINYSDEPENADVISQKGSQALKITKTLAPIYGGGITLETIQKARELVIKYSFDIPSFERLVTVLSEKLKL